MAAKRPIVVEGNTPGKSENKKRSTEGCSKRSLFQEGNIPTKASGRKEWTEAETTALVQYICLFWDDAGFSKWPTHSDQKILEWLC